ncbi:MAG: hypothetical protein QM723_27485 [Myxococcaceae bacterium]
MKLKKLIDWGNSNTRPPTPEDVAQVLKTTRDGDVPLYLSNPPYFLFALFVPNELLTGNFADDIAAWNTSAPSGFGWGLRWSEVGEVPYLSEPLDHTSSEILDQGMAPLFVRHFEGRDSYIEPNQRFTHVLELHRAGEATDWCRVNELGELVPTLRVAETEELSICTIDRDALNRFLVAAGMSMVRLFVVNATANSELFMARAPENREWSNLPDEIFLRTTYVKGELVLVRGFDVVRVPSNEHDQVLRALQGHEPREYATFTINDFRNKRTIDWSSEPAQIGNYFVESELPFGTSPAFFKPEVLTQYRTDPSRFHVLPDRVECVGAWSIPYYVNEEGLVHAYLCDLSLLPHPEQLKWKAHNVAPDGGIAKRAWERDFMAEWPSDYDPLVSLRQALQEFPAADSNGAPTAIWALGHLPPGRDLNFLGYVVTSSRKEFDDQVAALVQIVVEGLNRGEINRLGDELGCREDKQLGSLKQLGKVLDSLKVDPSVSKLILDPLVEVQGIRSKSVAHRGSSPITGDQRQVFRDLLASCDKAMRALAELVRKGVFTTAPVSVGR